MLSGSKSLLTFTFVFVILAVTRRVSNATVAGLVIGLCLTLVHIIGIPVDGTSVNPARSIGPAIFVGGIGPQPAMGVHYFARSSVELAAVVFQFLYPEG